MQRRVIQLKWRRLRRKSQRQVEDLGIQAEETIENHLFSRFNHLLEVKRFAATWVGLVVILIVAVFIENIDLSGYYQVVQNVPGGIYSEGLVGSFTNANPIYATTDADSTVAHLVFAGLFTNDNHGNLTGDLASSYSVDSTEKVYTVHLKPNLKWQDGAPLTSKDVVFTYDTIENPDAASPLFNSWQGINVSAPNPTTVVFKLPDVLASFPYNLTTGIIPEHLLSKITPSDLRSADFNTMHPVGAGPFSWQGLQVQNSSDPNQEQVQIALMPFKDYVLGQPKLDQFIVDVYAQQQQLVQAFSSNSITAMLATSPPPLSVQNKSGVQSYNFLMRAANMVFF